MSAADIINDVVAGKTVTKKRTVGKGKKAVELTVTRTEPTTVKVVDETVPQNAGTLPVDAGKRTVEVLPGLKLVVYTKGYVCLRMKGKAWGGNKVDIGKPLYREDIKALVEALFNEGQNAKTYAEANGIAAAPVGNAADFENVPF